ncbi:UDP-N-acetylmuramoyl-tripeptide--D-alanyl-D-alanine ligase [Leptospira yanagawae serovar Saopaulo str. Sao Paulo = ATCC 700523]|uniref:UDP-N-acetylmuramoyl-tripeptide--D-alanyl-D-alanine ligase n=1 Tax=Leptospira yanagawae serovar Saopaulo str. Sao Paulo = ATCC 700523 TaxID=1249483 RepID=A0A5E8H9R1_9LEPT|nr:UDP-N-acetylmuramoyl-tripeptide--D-alanyl-D-alanine ligase [Leptospira yanagawae serovar Saopaulo str. Sao Paulo = ATCC 700523]
MIAPFEYSLSTILSLFSSKPDWENPSNPKFQWISTSSREIKKNTVFVPLRGERDGHEFILDALKNGATGFLCEPNHPILKDLPITEHKKAIFVKDTLQALGTLANYHRNRFSPVLIAITGSSGKTTTKDLLGGLFGFLNPKSLVVTEKNYNNEIGVPFTLFRITENTRVVICEMGMNHRGEIKKLSQIAEPTHALITNIGSAHIENLKSRKNIAEEKIDIISCLRTGGVLFVPDDLEFLERAKVRTKQSKRNLVIWKHSKQPELKVNSVKKNGFILSWNNELIPWNIPGQKLLSNVRGMLAVGNYFAIPKIHILKTITSYKSPNKRLNILKGYYTIIDDCYNANPESMSSSIDACLQFAEKKEIVWVLGTMKELGTFSKYYHEKIGKELNQIGKGILLGLGEETLPMVKQVRGSKHFLEKNALIHYIKTEIPKQSVILVKGSRSMKMEEIVSELQTFKG